jgi:putative membrane protein
MSREGSLDRDASPTAALALRGSLGGVLMGLANLVPGISGGTMLLATGVYPAFISGIAEVTTLRFRTRSIVLLGAVAASAAAAILLLAGATKALVVDHRWVMYSLFIGLTLGGVPIVWRLARPASPAVTLGAIVGVAVMLAMAFGGAVRGASEGHAYGLLFLSGLAGAAAMILPGISGGYLLLLLGQYLPILGAIDDLKRGLLGQPTELELVIGSLYVIIPVGLGVFAGVVGVSNLLRWLLRRFEKPTLGVLLGLLLGAVPGLWPFQQGVPPKPGDVIEGTRITATNAATIPAEDWRVEYFRPTAGGVGAAILLVLAGLATTTLIGRLDRGSERA